MTAIAPPAAACPPVSVVMPLLNQAAFLADSVTSVLTQAPDGIELVVADGGSTDGGLERLAELAARFPGRLHWVSAPDSGPAQAVNRAVARARGPVIGWLNADDLYAPGAVARALAQFDAQPEQLMVYGEGEHVDIDGASLGRYPTRGPDTPLAAWAEGCPICQPTVFFRRETFVALGGLDETLRAAFDFEFWLRLLKAYPGRVGFVPALQAHSRLHAGGITLRERQRVALEGMQVIHRHLGPAPGAWLLTHFGELSRQHPFHATPKDLVAELHRLVDTAAHWILPETAAMLRGRIDGDRPLQLATPQAYVDVHPDGWAGASLELRVWQPPRPWAALRLQGRNARPGGGTLRLRIVAPDGAVRTAEVIGPGPFELVLPLGEPQGDEQVIVRVECLDSYVPADHEPGSDDRRALAFLVEGWAPLPAQAGGTG